MPPLNYTIVVWNIQNFGSAGSASGANGVRRSNFIARYIRSISADVLGIIETTPSALDPVRVLMRALNATQVGINRDWAFDIIKSALVDGEALTRSEATTWANGGPRREGYTLLWRTRRIRIVPAARPISEGAEKGSGTPLTSTHYLDLVTNGRPLELVSGQWTITGGYTQASIWPIKNNAEVQPWPALNFLTVSKGGSSRPTYQKTRRPAFAIIKTEVGSSKATVMPLLMFHSPSYGTLAWASVWISSLAQQHYVNHPVVDGLQNTATLVSIDRVATSGDYNHSETPTWPGAYNSYTNAFNKTKDGGIQSLALLDPTFTPDDTRTTIQLSEYGTGRFNGDPIDSDDPGDYRRMSIDNLFYRSVAEDGGSGTQNLVATVMDPNNAMKAPIKTYKSYLDEKVRENDHLDQGGPYMLRTRKHKGKTFIDKAYAIPNIIDWTELYDGVKQGYFDTARSAAEFIRLFVSDHLPLILKFTVGS